MSSQRSKCSFCGQSLNNNQIMCKEDLYKKRIRLDPSCDSHDALHRALRAKDCAIVTQLLKTRHKLCCTDGIENCYILITKFYNCECLERVLTSQPSAIHCRGPEGQTLLMYAKDTEVLNILLKFDPDLGVRDDNGENVLFHLIHQRTNKFKIYAWDCMYFQMIHRVLSHGLDVNATDSQDKSAIEYVLAKDSDQYFQLINILLESGAVIPPRDSMGRTPMMQLAKHASHEEYFNIIEQLLKQGADPKARDNDGHNLMHHVVTSYQDATELFMDFQQISQQCLKLLESGCELGGMDIRFSDTSCFQYTVNSVLSFKTSVTSVNILSLLLFHRPFCKFIRELPQSGLTLTRSEQSVSELTSYLLGNRRWPIDDDMFVIFESTVTNLLDSGVNVMQQALEWNYEYNTLLQEFRRDLPDALLLAGLLLFRVALNIPRTNSMKAFEITCKIFVSLLRFWPQPPLTLIMFPLDIYELKCESEEPESFFMLTMLNFLTRVGGRLPLGTPVYHRTRTLLETLCSNEMDETRNAACLFVKAHAKIPSLREICRHQIRATLRVTTVRGLDTSSLLVPRHGKWVPVPQQIVDYLNFRTQDEFCEDDLPPFQGNYGTSDSEVSSDEAPMVSDDDDDAPNIPDVFVANFPVAQESTDSSTSDSD